MTTIHDRLPEPDVDVVPSVRRWGTLMLGASAVGIVSGSITVMDKIALLKDPTAGSFCDISSTVGCSPVLLAWQSSVLGPPNALLGVIMFAVLATAGAVQRGAAGLAAGKWDVLIALGWGAIIAAMLFAGIWL